MSNDKGPTSKGTTPVTHGEELIDSGATFRCLVQESQAMQCTNGFIVTDTEAFASSHPQIFVRD